MEGGGKGGKTCIQRNEKYERGNAICFICDEPRELKEGMREVDDEHS